MIKAGKMISIAFVCCLWPRVLSRAECWLRLLKYLRHSVHSHLPGALLGIYGPGIPHIALSKTSLLALKKSHKPDQTQPLTHHN